MPSTIVDSPRFLQGGEEASSVGWISVVKNGRSRGRIIAISVPSTATGSSPASVDRVSLSSPEEGRCIIRAGGADFLLPPFERMWHSGRVELSGDNSIEEVPIGIDFTPAGESKEDWLPQKIVECGMVVGISVDNTKRGWDNLVSIAKDWKNQCRGDLCSNKSK